MILMAVNSPCKGSCPRVASATTPSNSSPRYSIMRAARIFRWKGHTKTCAARPVTKTPGQSTTRRCCSTSPRRTNASIATARLPQAPVHNRSRKRTATVSITPQFCCKCSGLPYTPKGFRLGKSSSSRVQVTRKQVARRTQGWYIIAARNSFRNLFCIFKPR